MRCSPSNPDLEVRRACQDDTHIFVGRRVMIANQTNQCILVSGTDVIASDLSAPVYCKYWINDSASNSIEQ